MKDYYPIIKTITVTLFPDQVIIYFLLTWSDSAQSQSVFSSSVVGAAPGFFSLKLLGGILSLVTMLHIAFALSACFSGEYLSQFDKLTCARAIAFPGSA